MCIANRAQISLKKSCTNEHTCTMRTSNFGELKRKNLHSAVEMNCVTTFLSYCRCGSSQTKSRMKESRSVQISQFVQSLILLASALEVIAQ